MKIKLLMYLRKYLKDKLFPCMKVFIFRLKFPSSTISSTVNVSIENYNNVSLEPGVYIGHYTTIVEQNDKLNALDNSSLYVGRDTYIGEYNNIRAGGGEIRIGSNCLISQHITIVASSHNTRLGNNIQEQSWTIDKNYVIIEDDVWIGANSVILPGVVIHKGAVVGAGSIVTKDIPENAIVFGSPAKVKKYREL